MSYSILFDLNNIQIKIFKSVNTIETIILDLFNKIFKRDYPIELFKWYELLCGENTWCLAQEKDTGKFVGMYGLMPIKTFLKGKEYKSYLAHNAGVIDKYRGQGMFQYIGEVILKNTLGNYEFAIGFPNSFAINGHIKIGWQSIGEMNFFYKLSDKFRYSNKPDFDNIYEVDKFSEEIDKLIIKQSKKYDFVLKKDSNFLNWRITKANQKYRCFKYIKNGEIEGYMIFKFYYDIKNNIKKGHIIDIQASNDKIFKALVEKAEALSKKYNIDLLNIWVFHRSILKNLLTEENYIIDKESFCTPPIIYFKDKYIGSLIYQLDKENILLSLADNDVF